MATTAQVNAIAALYAGYFNRAPDPAGLQFWIDQLDNGRDYNTIAEDFAESPEATALYPYLTAPGVASPSTFITSVYQNLFNRAPDAEGLAFWTGVLNDKSVSVADMIEAIIEGAVNAPTATPPTFDKTTLDNKVEVGLDFASDAANTPGFTFDAAAKAAAVAVIDGVTSDPATVAAAKAETDAFLTGTSTAGDTFTLTKGVDDINGTDGDDVINAMTTNDTIAPVTTLSSFDDIDGGDGTDTLNIFTDATFFPVNAGFPASASVKNVEIININNAAPVFGPVDASNFEGATQIWQTQFADNVSNLEATTTAGFRKTTVGTFGVTAAATAASAAVALEDAAEASTFNVSGAALASAAVSGTVADTNNDGAIAPLTLNVTAGTDVQAVAVETSADATLTVANAGGKAVTSVDASASAGDINYMTAGVAVATIKTGAGDDMVNIKTTTPAAAALVETGAGNDTITVATANGTGTTTVNAGAGNDTVTLNSDGTGKLSVDLGEGDDAFMVGGKAAVSKGDVVDGGAGTDTLQLKDVGAANISAFSNFEVFDVVGLNTTLDVDILASNNTVTEIVGSGALAGASTLTNLGAGVNFRATGDMGVNTLSLTQKTAGELSVTLDADGAAADLSVNATNAKTVNVVFDADSTTTAMAQEIDLSADAATAINVTSGGSKATNDLDVLANTKLTTVTVSGAQDLDLDLVGGNVVTSINASALTGDLTVNTADLKAESAVNAFDGGMLTLGSGDDMVTVTTGAKIASIGKASGEDAATQEDFDVLLGTGATQAGDATTASVTIKDGLLTFSGAGPTTLADAITLVDAAVTTAGEAVVFEYIGDSYVFVEAGAADVLVELTGTTGLNGLDNVNTTTDLYVF